MTPDQRREAVQRAEKAVVLIEDLPWSELTEKIMQEWQKEPTAQKREDLWHEIQALGRVKTRLLATVQTAQVAAMEMAAEQKAASGKVDPYEIA